jgi:menaquinone-specific isochorismate synthase
VTSPALDNIARRLDLRAQTGAFDWRTPEGGEISGAGAVARFEASGPDRFEAAREWLRALSDSGTLRHEGDTPAPLIAVGGFSFAPNSLGSAASLGDAVFWVPERIARRAPGGETETGRWRRADGTRRPEAPRPPARSAFHAMGRSAWTGIVREALDRIASGTLQKVVLARGVEIESAVPVDPRALLHLIAEANPRAYRYLLRPAQGAAFLGASPERLVSLADGAVASDAVAGTVRLEYPDWSDAAGASNGAAVASLLASEKDRREHAPVVRHIVEALSPLCTVVTASEAAAQVHRRLAHLRTAIRGLAKPGTHVLDLVERLHPTPAVAGTPGDLALEFLREREPVDRGWYAGVVGWMDANGNGDFVVGIRSAFLDGSRTLLFAGAGIVAGSNPDAEWEETELKLSMMREAIANAGR